MPTIGLLIATYFLATFAMANLESTLSLFTEDAYRYTDAENALVFAYVGFTLAFVQGGIYRPLAKRVSEVAFIRMGIVFMLLGLGGLGLRRNRREWPAHWDRFAHLAADRFSRGCHRLRFYESIGERAGIAPRRGRPPGRSARRQSIGQRIGAHSRPGDGPHMFRLTPNHALPYAVSSAMLLIVLVLTRRMEN